MWCINRVKSCGQKSLNIFMSYGRSTYSGDPLEVESMRVDLYEISLVFAKRSPGSFLSLS